MKLLSFLTKSALMLTSMMAVGTTVAAPISDDIHCPSVEQIHKAASSLSHTKVETNGKYNAVGLFPFHVEKNLSWHLLVGDITAQDDNDAITKGRVMAATVDTVLSDKPDEVMFKTCLYYSGQLDRDRLFVAAIAWPSMTALFNTAIKQMKR